MSNIPQDLRYTKEHEWAKLEGNTLTVGITDHAQAQLGDIVFVELPEVGRELSDNETFGVVESIKAVSDLYSPLPGKVVETNPKIVDEPSLLNDQPYDDSWLIKLELKDASSFESLMDAQAYSDHVASEG